jgi:membrane protein implicated in regulation of membrane protease activity
MADGERPSEPTELIFLPKASWAPAFIAAGLVAVLIGLYKGWVYIAVGAVLALLAIRSWVRETGTDLDRLPRRQRPTTAVIPVLPPRGDDAE